MLLQLKSIRQPYRFAVLLKPELAPGEVRNDTELFNRVIAANGAIIMEYQGASFELDRVPVRLSVGEFQSNWIGD